MPKDMLLCLIVVRMSVLHCAARGQNSSANTNYKDCQNDGCLITSPAQADQVYVSELQEQAPLPTWKTDLQNIIFYMI